MPLVRRGRAKPRPNASHHQGVAVEKNAQGVPHRAGLRRRLRVAGDAAVAVEEGPHVRPDAADAQPSSHAELQCRGAGIVEPHLVQVLAVHDEIEVRRLRRGIPTHRRRHVAILASEHARADAAVKQVHDAHERGREACRIAAVHVPPGLQFDAAILVLGAGIQAWVHEAVPRRAKDELVRRHAELQKPEQPTLDEGVRGIRGGDAAVEDLGPHGVGHDEEHIAGRRQRHEVVVPPVDVVRRPRHAHRDLRAGYGGVQRHGRLADERHVLRVPLGGGGAGRLVQRVLEVKGHSIHEAIPDARDQVVDPDLPLGGIG
mmetsp:Transcript_93425/g.269029  ORF Transcript_93425/g.269029 Transcript_93425/m.269029 type:complete len:316 (-) Transcript_93425:394-1341(-)